MGVDLSSEKDDSYKPTLHDVHNILEDKIVGEHQSRMALFTTWVLSDRNVLIQGPRSSGKTFISDDVSEKFLGIRKSFSDDEKGDDTGRCYPITLGSDKSTWYQVEQINAASHILIYEMQQMPKDFMEVLKKWGEGKEATYKVTQNIGGVKGIKPYTLYPRPFILCLADEEEVKVGEQFLSRVVIIRTDNTLEQTDAIKIRQSLIAKGVYKPIESSDTLDKMKQHISTLPPFKSVKYIHPAADMFVDVVPSFFTDARRDFPKYLDNCYGIARFYWKERIIGKTKTSDKLLFITPQDMYLNHIIYGQIAVESSLKCSSSDRTMIEIIRKSTIKMKSRDVQRELMKNDMNISVHMVSNHLSKLADIGYIEREKKSNVTLYEPGEMFDKFSTDVDWKKVIKCCQDYMKDKYPAIYEKYNETYCIKCTVLHPFSGKEVNLLEIESEEPVEPKKEGLSKFHKDIKKEDKEQTIGEEEIEPMEDIEEEYVEDG